MPQNPCFPEHYSGSSGFGVMQGPSSAQFSRMQLLYMAHATYIMHGYLLLLERATHAGKSEVHSWISCMPSSGCPWSWPAWMPKMWPLLAHVHILRPCTRMHLVPAHAEGAECTQKHPSAAKTAGMDSTRGPFLAQEMHPDAHENADSQTQKHR